MMVYNNNFVNVLSFSKPFRSWTLFVCILCLLLTCASSSDVIVGAGGSVDVTLNVSAPLDGPATISDCYPVSTDLCNIRSAWEACDQLSNSTQKCVISILPNVNSTIDSFYGELILVETNNIELRGGGNWVVFNNTEAAVVEVPFTDSFPFNFSVSDTDDALQNYATACFDALVGATLRFSACGSVNATEIDTYFRLYNNDGEQVAMNDDFCGLASEIVYTVPGIPVPTNESDDAYYSYYEESNDAYYSYYEESVTTTALSEPNTFCLHMGCAGSGACNASVDGFYTTSSAPRFLYYERDPTVAATTVPTLSITGLSFRGFGGPDFPGGTMYFQGEAVVSVSDSGFVDSIGAAGGAIYIGSNTLAPDIINCNFSSCSGSSGGGLYIGEGVHSFNVSDSSFSYCTATIDGGGVFIDNNLNGSISSVTLDECMAQSGLGGGICVNVNANMSLSDVTASGCSANYGGAMYFTQSDSMSLSGVTAFDCSANFHGGAMYITDCDSMSLSGVIASGCSADFDGGAIYTADSHSMSLSGVTASGCSAEYGGGLLIEYCDSMSLSDMTVSDCSSSVNGGAIYVGESHYMSLSGVTASGSSADYGGGFFITFCESMVVSNITMSDCYGTDGGGCYITQSDSMSLSNITASGCSASYGGGCYITHMSSMSVSDITVSDCSANLGFGGGLFGYILDSVSLSGVTATGSSADYGGGVVIYAGSSMIISNITTAGCSAGSGGGGFMIEESDSISLAGVTASGCTAGSNGGGFRIENSNTISLSGVTASGCSANSKGGGYYITGSDSISLAGVIASGCSASSNGGGFHITDSDSLFLSNITTSDCSADVDGGGGYISSSDSISLAGVTASGCSASSNGGGFHITDSDSIFLSNITTSDCSADVDGGGFYIYSSDSISLSGVTASGCSASSNGGGVYASNDDNLSLFNYTANDCSAGVDGGFAYFDSYNTDLSLVGVSVSNCWAISHGGGIFMNQDNSNAQLVGLRVTNSTAHFGAGVYFAHSNSFSMENVTVERCTAIAGGGIMLAGDNTGSIDESVVERCVAQRGSSLYLITGNMLTVSDSVLQNCSTSFTNAGVFGSRAANDIVTSDVVFSECSMALLPEVVLYVTDEKDGVSNTSACHPVPTDSCNIRSAWDACSLLSSSTQACIIDMLPNMNSTIKPFEFGSLVMNATNNIDIQGHGSVVELALDPFPLHYEANDTDNALQNYVSNCVVGCGGTTLVFSSCGGPFDWDTYFRLFKGSEQVAANDDGCGPGYYASEISYDVPGEPTECSSYCLHMGCYSLDSCNATVTMHNGKLNRGLLYYEQAVSEADLIVPTLAISDLTVVGGYSSDTGGAMSFNGTAFLSFSNITVENSRADSLGGGMFIGSNSLGVVLDTCVLSDNNAAYGGGLYITDTPYFIVSDSKFDSCAANVAGGAVFIDSNSSWGLITGSDSVNVLQSCSAANGGGIYMSEGSDNVTLRDVNVYSCAASSNGGFLFVETQNDFLTVATAFISACTAGDSGGAMYLDSANMFATVVNSVIEDCKANNGFGGGIAIGTANTGASMSNVSILGCSVTGSGGGLALYSNNQNVSFVGVSVSDCSASDSGGGLYMFEMNDYAAIHNSSIDDCSAVDGGGVYIATANQYLNMESVDIQGCAASKNGGGVGIESSNNYLSLAGVFVSNCDANAAGGGIFVDQTNIVISMADITVEQCSASTGGGVSVGSGNTYLNLNNCTVSNCTATGEVSTTGGMGYGGGLSVYQDNSYLSVSDSLFEYNVAVKGGGVQLGNGNEFVSFAGSTFRKNIAANTGGGLFVMSNNPNLVIIDGRGGALSSTLQSAHPYSSGPMSDGNPYVIFNATVSEADSTAYIMNFDPTTSLFWTDTLAIYDNSVDRNVLAWYQDTADFPGLNLPPLRVNRSSFYIEFFGSTNSSYTGPYDNDAYGFTLYVYPVVASPPSPSTFIGNRAGTNGGAIYFFSAAVFPLIINTRVVDNYADSAGGGLLLHFETSGLACEAVVFESNEARLDGGAVALMSDQYGIWFRNCAFSGNIAGGYGGAVLMSTDNGVGSFIRSNEIQFQNSFFGNNSATAGGAVALDQSNTVSFSDCEMSSNIATTGAGGAIWLQHSCILTSVNSSFTQNEALTCGGAIASSDYSAVYMTGSVLTSNQAAGAGGAMCLEAGSTCTFSDSNVFSDNFSPFGGGIASYSSPIFKSAGEVTFAGNAAMWGSALTFMDIVVDSTGLGNMSFFENSASGGGTVYWVYDSESQPNPPAGVDSSSITWLNNSAPYGVQVGTQGIQLLGPMEYVVDVYNGNLDPALEFQLYDFYGSRMPLNGTTPVYAAIVAASADTCNGRFPFLSGTDMFGEGVVFRGGFASFAELQVYCAPVGTLELSFEARQGSEMGTSVSEAGAYYVSNTTSLTFRSCTTGEVMSNGACVQCPSGSYSLVEDVTEETSCLSCEVSGVDSCHGSELVLETGFVRRYPTTDAVMECPLVPNSCQGGNLTGSASCGVGYTGELCAVCEPGYFPHDDECLKCEAASIFSPSLIAYLVIFIMIIAGAIVSGYIYHEYLQKDEAKLIAMRTARAEALGEQGQGQTDDLESDYEKGSGQDSSARNTMSKDPEAEETLVDRLMIWVGEKRAKLIRMMGKIKIVVSTYQVISSTTSALHVRMPTSFTNFMDSLSFVNLSVGTLLPISCGETYTFIDELYVVTLVPIGIAACFLTAFVCEYSYVRKKIMSNWFRTRGEKGRAFNDIKTKYLSLFFYLTYLILPSVTTTIFQMYLCTDVDPDNETPGADNWYLTADMRISCTSNYYNGGVAYASVMVVVYPVGIPLLYLWMLYSNREDIKNRNIAGAGEPGEELSIAAEADGTVSVNPMQSNISGAANSKTATAGVDKHQEAQTELSSLLATVARLKKENAEMKGQLHDVKPPLSKQVSSITISNGEAPLSRPSLNGQGTSTNRLSLRSLMGEEPEEEHSNVNANTARLRFLWASYQPQFWYWEVIETTRRLMLTAVLSMVAPGSSIQSVFSILMAQFYLKLYGHFTPYSEGSENVLAEIGQYQIFFTFFVALIIQNGLLNSTWNQALGAILITINLSVIVYCYHLELSEHMVAFNAQLRLPRSEWLERLFPWIQTARPAEQWAEQSGSTGTGTKQRPDEGDCGSEGIQLSSIAHAGVV